MIVQLRKKEITLGKKRWCDHRGRMSNWDFGMGSSGRSSRFDLDSYRFDETINNAIHGMLLVIRQSVILCNNRPYYH